MILDHDLAALYEVPTRVLIQAVKRNAVRFPSDFMLQLSAREFGGRPANRAYLSAASPAQA